MHIFKNAYFEIPTCFYLLTFVILELPTNLAKFYHISDISRNRSQLRIYS